LGGVEGSGWKLVYTDTASGLLRSLEHEGGRINEAYTVGLVLKDDGAVLDTIEGMTAARAGIGPGMKIVAVNGRRFSTELLHDAIKTAKNGSEPIELLVENTDYFKTFNSTITRREVSAPGAGGVEAGLAERDHQSEVAASFALWTTEHLRFSRRGGTDLSFEPQIRRGTSCVWTRLAAVQRGQTPSLPSFLQLANRSVSRTAGLGAEVPRGETSLRVRGPGCVLSPSERPGLGWCGPRTRRSWWRGDLQFG